MRYIKSGRKLFHNRVLQMIKNNPMVLAIDVGASKISGAIVDRNLKIFHKDLKASRDSVTGLADQNLDRTKKMIKALHVVANNEDISIFSAAAGFPEYVDLAGNLTSRDQIDWKIQPSLDFSQILPVPWTIQSDVRCAGIAEARLGSGKNESDFVYITISTGISHTHFIGGKPISGFDGRAIGFGVIEIDTGSEIAPLENFSSGLGIARRYSAITGDTNINANSLFADFKSNSLAREIIESAAAILGREIAIFGNSLPTKVIVIGGGLWMGSEIYRNLVLTSFRKIAKELGYNGNILNATVSDAGVIGTAIYALDSLTN